MSDNSYTKERTALLFVDPYNDFLSDGGKLWPLVEGVAREVGSTLGFRTGCARPTRTRSTQICWRSSRRR